MLPDVAVGAVFTEPVSFQVLTIGAGGLEPSAVVALAWEGPTGGDGLATVRVTAGGGPVPLPPRRADLDSQVFYVYFRDEDGQLVADALLGPGLPPISNLTVLRFQRYQPPAQPTWANDVAPILGAYARLFPGMKDRLDIGDEATVRGFAGAVLGRLSLPFLDPGYMPVTRDLSPAKVQMLRAWLAAQLPPQQP